MVKGKKAIAMGYWVGIVSLLILGLLFILSVTGTLDRILALAP